MVLRTTTNHERSVKGLLKTKGLRLLSKEYSPGNANLRLAWGFVDTPMGWLEDVLRKGAARELVERQQFPFCSLISPLTSPEPSVSRTPCS